MAYVSKGLGQAPTTSSEPVPWWLWLMIGLKVFSFIRGK